MTKCSLVMTPTTRRMAGCIISIRPAYLCAGVGLLTYLLTQVGSESIKPAVSSKRLKIERKLLLTAYIKSYTGRGVATGVDIGIYTPQNQPK